MELIEFVNLYLAAEDDIKILVEDVLAECQQRP